MTASGLPAAIGVAPVSDGATTAAAKSPGAVPQVLLGAEPSSPAVAGDSRRTTTESWTDARLRALDQPSMSQPRPPTRALIWVLLGGFLVWMLATNPAEFAGIAVGVSVARFTVALLPEGFVERLRPMVQVAVSLLTWSGLVGLGLAQRAGSPFDRGFAEGYFAALSEPAARVLFGGRSRTEERRP